jgi:uncharacterized membrane protein
MDKKTLSIVSYITIIGWIIALVQYKGEKAPEVRFHLKQSLGVMLLGLVFSIAMTIITSIVPSLYFLSYANLVILVLWILWILGIINAANGAQKQLPLIGGFAERKLNFI